jgi:Arc/MetJ family transcription regulator
MIHMKRTNLVLDEQLLEQATQALGAKTYSATVNLALEEALKLARIRRMGSLFGAQVWESDERPGTVVRPERATRSRRGKSKSA